MGRLPVALLLLAPLLGVGLFDRVLWTPDEPREADIAWQQSLQAPTALAEFAGAPWLEKPPLTYWLAGAALALCGDSAGAARLPNVFYAFVLAVAVYALAASLAGAEAGLVATLVAGSSLLLWRVSIWLAPDAGLMAGIAVALLGLWRGFVAPPGRTKLYGYGLMHLGAAFGFMAKSAVAWGVPGLALGLLILWERRGRELRRPELWAGFGLQILLVGVWIILVARQSDGYSDLRGLFWNNLVGRFADVPSLGGPRYADGHANHFGKYLLELPVDLLPWTGLAVAAFGRALHGVRAPDPRRLAWRFALAATLPWLVLVSLARTARDIYAAPALIGVALLTGLALSEWSAPQASGATLAALAPARPYPDDRPRGHLAERGMACALWATLATAAVLGLLLLAAGTVLLLAVGAAGPGATPSASGAVARIAALVALTLGLLVGIPQAVAALRARTWVAAFCRVYGVYAGAVILWGLAFFPLIDTAQDLRRLGGTIAAAVAARPFALLAPDETTIAMMDHPYRRALVVDVRAPDRGAPDRAGISAARAWLARSGPEARLLVKLPGTAPGPLSRWLAARFGATLWSADDGAAAVLERAGVAVIVTRFALPDGRRYALLAAPPAR